MTSNNSIFDDDIGYRCHQQYGCYPRVPYIQECKTKKDCEHSEQRFDCIRGICMPKRCEKVF